MGSYGYNQTIVPAGHDCRMECSRNTPFSGTQITRRTIVLCRRIPQNTKASKNHKKMFSVSNAGSIRLFRPAVVLTYGHSLKAHRTQCVGNIRNLHHPRKPCQRRIERAVSSLCMGIRAAHEPLGPNGINFFDLFWNLRGQHIGLSSRAQHIVFNAYPSKSGPFFDLIPVVCIVEPIS